MNHLPQDTESISSPRTMSLAKGLLVLSGVVVGVGGFIGLCAALGIKELWGGFYSYSIGAVSST